MNIAERNSFNENINQPSTQTHIKTVAQPHFIEPAELLHHLQKSLWLWVRKDIANLWIYERTQYKKHAPRRIIFFSNLSSTLKALRPDQVSFAQFSISIRQAGVMRKSSLPCREFIFQWSWAAFGSWVGPSGGWVENANQIKSSRMRRVKYTLTVIRGPINGRRLHAACNMTCLMVSNNQSTQPPNCYIPLHERYAFPRTWRCTPKSNNQIISADNNFN